MVSQKITFDFVAGLVEEAIQVAGQCVHAETVLDQGGKPINALRMSVGSRHRKTRTNGGRLSMRLSLRVGQQGPQ